MRCSIVLGFVFPVGARWSLPPQAGLRYRERHMLNPAIHGGAGCQGNLLEAEACDLRKVDCEARRRGAARSGNGGGPLGINVDQWT